MEKNNKNNITNANVCNVSSASHRQNRARISEYYLPLLKDISQDAKLVSHQYCLRAGLVKQCGAGIYTWLPLGLKIMKNIENIVRAELDRAGLLEILMPCIQQAEIWQESGRYQSYGQEMLRFLDRHNHEMLFGPTNEELMTYIARGHINSYKQLPKIFYHIQWKFRDEIRPRFGLLRAREFLMKDAYSFDCNEEQAKKSYNKIYLAYLNIFKKLGVKVIPCKADAGAIGGNLNHEFHLICPSGESKIFYNPEILKRQETLYEELASVQEVEIPVTEREEKLLKLIEELQNIYSVTEEAHNNEEALERENNNIVCANGIEVGHIFYFGTKYSAPMKAQFFNAKGIPEDMYMGSYGIGISRLVAAIIEANYDANGIIWPEEIAPYKLGLINLHKESALIAEEIYKKYNNIIYEDSNCSAGIKFARMDLIGIPKQIIVSKNSLINSTVEIKDRRSGAKEIINISSLEKI